jgi:hypothetical protein
MSILNLHACSVFNYDGNMTYKYLGDQAATVSATFELRRIGLRIVNRTKEVDGVNNYPRTRKPPLTTLKETWHTKVRVVNCRTLCALRCKTFQGTTYSNSG